MLLKEAFRWLLVSCSASPGRVAWVSAGELLLEAYA
jgi:hypothetical protein